MALITQPTPSGDILSIYAPISYELTATTAFGNPPIIKAEVFINGVLFGNEYAQPHYKVISGTYYFRFDVSERLRSYVSNTDTFDLGGNTNVEPAANASNAGFAKECTFYVVFTVWESSGVNGVYEASATTYTSNSLFGLNIAANQYIDENTIEDYGAVLPFKFLTAAPNKQALSLGDKAYLSFFDRGASRRGFRVQTYSTAGALLATVYYDIGQALNTVNRVRRIAIGAADIALLTSLAGVHYYTICIVDDITAPVPLVLSEVREYYLTQECTKFSLHFLNAFGADDVVRFSDYQYTNTTEKETYLANSPTYPLASNRGLTVLNSRGTRKLILTKVNVVNRLLQWFYELQNTSVAFAQASGASTYIAVTVDKIADFAAQGTELSTRTVEVECQLSQIDYSHSN